MLKSKKVFDWIKSIPNIAKHTLKHKNRVFLDYDYRDWHFTFSGVRMRKTYCIGILSRTEDNQHILMCDYDNIFFDVVKQDIEFLQKKFRYGTAYIFATKREFKGLRQEIGNYHVYFLEKDTFENVRKVMDYLHCDKQHNQQEAFFEKGWVLRISNKGDRPKPVFIGRIDKDTTREKSSAHLKFLESFAKIKVCERHNSSFCVVDGLEKIETNKYETLVG